MPYDRTIDDLYKYINQNVLLYFVNWNNIYK